MQRGMTRFLAFVGPDRTRRVLALCIYRPTQAFPVGENFANFGGPQFSLQPLQENPTSDY